jgi:hypothetical protein
VRILVVCISLQFTAEAESTNSSTEISWNDPSLVMIQGAWAKEPGVDRLQSLVSDQLDPRGPYYAADFKKWASFLVRPEFLLQGFESNAIPVRMGYLTVAGGGNPSNSVPGKDGFIVRYVTGGYAVQLTDTRFDFQILVRDLGTNAARHTYQEKAEAGEKIMRLFLHNELVLYPDGTNRKLTILDRGSHASADWNWQVQEKERDTRPATTSLARPYNALAVWRSDGESTLLCFLKTYFTSTVEIIRSSTGSRFDVRVAFHDIGEE